MSVVARIESDAERAASREELGRATFEHAPIGMATIRLDGLVDEANHALCAMLGRTRAEVEGSSVTLYAHADDLVSGMRAAGTLLAGRLEVFVDDLRVVAADQTTLWTQVHATVLHHLDGTPRRLLVQVQDVTERRIFESRLQQMADHDPLTGLLNRRAFETEVERHLARCRRYGADGALLLLDVDHFKYVNDALGHSAGDELIVLMADVLRARLRESDVLARLGGDEFAVLLPKCSLEQATKVAEDLVANVRGHARGKRDGLLRPVTASIGIAGIDDAEATGDELLANADLAMYDAKEAGRDRATAFASDERDEPAIKSRMRWMERIQTAFVEDRFVLFGQPIVDLLTRDVVELELLLRMVGEDGEIIAPGAFLPVAERFGLIQELDRMVIAKAIALAARTGQTYSLNLSAKSLAEPGLVDVISDHLLSTGCKPSQLTFEITETAAVTNVGLARALAEGLHDLGCHLALDDFGAGFGSFYYLKHLPFDVLKIDGEFVSGCTSSTTDQLVIDALVRVAKGMGKQTVAEFTGDEETALLLREMGVDRAQGYYLGRPEPLS